MADLTFLFAPPQRIRCASGAGELVIPSWRAASLHAFWVDGLEVGQCAARRLSTEIHVQCYLALQQIVRDDVGGGWGHIHFPKVTPE